MVRLSDPQSQGSLESDPSEQEAHAHRHQGQRKKKPRHLGGAQRVLGLPHGSGQTIQPVPMRLVWSCPSGRTT